MTEFNPHTCGPNPPMLLDGTCTSCILDHATELVLEGEFRSTKDAINAIWKDINDHA